MRKKEKKTMFLHWEKLNYVTQVKISIDKDIFVQDTHRQNTKHDHDSR